jgi:hypothetical protein
MHRKSVPTENRLLLSLAKHGGSAPLTVIRLDFYGRLTTAALEQARQKLGDLVVSEKTRSKGSKRPTTSLSLTLRGWAAVQFLRPGWQPRRLAVPVLKEWLAELQAERDPWALQIARDRADAQAWTNHERERKARERAAEYERSKQKPEPKRPSAGRVRSDEENEARAEWARSKGFKPSYDDSNEKPDYDGSAAARKNAEAHTFKPAFTPRPLTSSTPQPTEPRTSQEKYLAVLRQPPPPPTLEQIEARRLEAERRQQNCVICQAGVDPNFLMHDPATHLAYL